MEKVLSVIAREMSKLNIDYHYMYNDNQHVIYPYVTAEYSENSYTHEENSTSADLLLEVWNRGGYIPLLEVAKTIKQHFSDFRYTCDNFAMCVTYDGCFAQRTNDIKLKKLEIHLSIKVWKGV